MNPRDKRFQQDKFQLMILDQLKNNIQIHKFQFSSKYIEQIFLVIELRIKNDILFESIIQAYFNAYMAYLSLTADKPQVNINGIYNRILSLPTDLVEDNTNDWQVYYKPIKGGPKQESKECKCHFLLKLIVFKSKEDILESKSKLWSLLAKAVEKEFSSVGLTILTVHYYYSIYRSLYLGEGLNVDSIYEILGNLYVKSKGLWSLNFSKLLGENYEKQKYFDSFLIGSINLIVKSTVNFPVVDSFVVNKNVKIKLFKDNYWNETTPVKLGGIMEQNKKNNPSVSVKKALLTLFVQLLIKNIEDTSSITRILTKAKEYLSTSPTLYSTLIVYLCIYLQPRKPFPQQSGANLEQLVEKFSNDVDSLTFICVYHQKTQGLFSQIGKNVKQPYLGKLFEQLIEYGGGFEEDFQETWNQNVVDALISIYKNMRHKKFQNVVITKLYWICKSISNQKKEQYYLTLLKQVTVFVPSKIQSKLFIIVDRILEILMLQFLKQEIFLETLLRIIKKLFNDDKFINVFLNMLVKTIISVSKKQSQKESELAEKQKIHKNQTPLDMSSLLFSVLGMHTEGAKNKVKTRFEHSYIQRAIQLIQNMTEYSDSMKKAFKFNLDRPSQISIQNYIMKNRFFMRLIFISKVPGPMKTIIGIVYEMEDKQQMLKLMYPQIGDEEARKVYLNYMCTKNLVDFRLEVQKHPQWKNYMPES